MQLSNRDSEYDHDTPCGDSVTGWIDGLKEGDSESIESLWNRYFQKLKQLASTRLPSNLKQDLDEEDIALSAFHSLCQGVRRGNFSDLSDRHNLWAVLVVITNRKIHYRRRYAAATKRGGGQRILDWNFDESGMGEFGKFIAQDPTPEVAVVVADELQFLVQSLDMPELKQVAELKLQGYTSQEIARDMNCGLRTVERRLNVIRKCWLSRVESESS